MRSLQKKIILISFLLLSSCGYSFFRTQREVDSKPTTSQKTAVDFESVKALIFTARCTTCHEQYQNYASVVREQQSILAAIRSDQMPKTGERLTASQKEALETWFANGAPEKSSSPEKSPGEPPTVLPLTADWKSISENLIFPKCLVCHNLQGQAKFLDLSTRQAIYNNRDRMFANGSKLLNFENSDTSYLIQVIQDPEEPMPPIASKIQQLTANEVQVLKQWITLGLP